MIAPPVTPAAPTEAKPIDYSGSGLVVCAFTITQTCCGHPVGNRISLKLIGLLLGDAAAADGHCAAGGVTTLGDLNNGVLLADYELAAQAAQSWLVGLRRTEMHHDAHLAWRDTGGVWHPVHPRILDFNFESVVTAEFLEREKENLQSLLLQSELALRQQRRVLGLSLAKGQS